jgi:glycosyltransferase involved in cell wall biosynthesis
VRKILFASWYIGLGGGETDLLMFASDLAQMDYELHLLVPREGQLSAQWRARGWKVHVVAFRGASTYFVPFIWSRFPIANKIAQLVQHENIELIHSDYHSLPYCAGASRQTGVPCVWTVWGWWFKPQVWQRAFFRQQQAVARSKSIREGFLGQPPFMPHDQLPLIYSGVDVERFQPNGDAQTIRELANVPKDALIVSMVARFQTVKGHDVFQDMASIIAQRLPNVHFIVAGEDVFGVASDREYKERILARAKADPILHERLHYIGFRDDVERVFATSDVVVCASDFESWGRANLEALACGKPVVSTNQGGPQETIVNGEVGLLVPPKNPQALAEAVLALLLNPTERERMGKNAREHVLNKFSSTQTSHDYDAWFKRVLGH